jgi:hypothetical protein
VKKMGVSLMTYLKCERKMRNENKHGSTVHLFTYDMHVIGQLIIVRGKNEEAIELQVCASMTFVGVASTLGEFIDTVALSEDDDGGEKGEA